MRRHAFLIVAMTLIVAILSAPVAMYAMDAGPFATCSTDTDCGCTLDCLE